MKRLLFLALLLGFVSASSFAQKNPQDRSLRFRNEQNFEKGKISPKKSFQKQKRKHHLKMERRKIHRNRFAHSRLHRKANLKNHTYRGKMLQHKQYKHNGRVI